MRITFNISGLEGSAHLERYSTRVVQELLRGFGERVSNVEVRLFPLETKKRETIVCMLMIEGPKQFRRTFDARANHPHVAMEHAAQSAWEFLRSTEWCGAA